MRRLRELELLERYSREVSEGEGRFVRYFRRIRIEGRQAERTPMFSSTRDQIAGR